MPIHDWTRMLTGDFHHFHARWIQAIADALNSGGLPPEYMALSEQVAGGPIPDVVTLKSAARPPKGEPGGLAVATAPPTARLVDHIERAVYRRKKDRVVIRHGRGKVVAIIELVSPGNKDSRDAIRAFVDKAHDILAQRVSLLVVDLFPPTRRDPQGIHKAIWDSYAGEKRPFEFLPDKPLTVASYTGGRASTAYVESVGVGDVLPSLPIFLDEDHYVPAPLEETYMQAWAVFPQMLKDVMEGRAE
jgi:hypothetical protein